MQGKNAPRAIIYRYACNLNVVYFNLTGNEKLIEEIVSKTSFKVKKEDKHSFIRNIKAGDHKNKLAPETIEKLNLLFKNELELLNYAD